VRVVVVVAIACAGCKQILGLHDLSKDAAHGDTTPVHDAPTDAPPGCDGAGPYVVCLSTQPTAAVTLGAQTIDTTMCAFNGNSAGQIYVPGMGHPALCVIAGRGISVTGVVRGVGANPLAIVSTESLTIDRSAGIDVSSAQGGSAGAGADYASCVVSGIDGQVGLSGGGGAGGNFGSSGGNGGGAGGGTSSPATGTPLFVRGGCRGGKGGDGMQGAGGTFGDSGGAVYVLARGTLTIDGSIDASGGGGGASQNAPKAGGAGGGGSGGMIVLYAPTVSQTADVFANGGGGGSVGGNPGGEATSAAMPGPGGLGPTSGGDGAYATATATSGVSGISGGGSGGGGGVGVVKMLGGGMLGANVSPPPS
jgi:hypothetical protein